MEGGRVDGVTLSSRRSGVRKKMAQISIAPLGANLNALHIDGIVHLLHQQILRDRFGERGPAGAAIEFVERSKERFPGSNIDVNTNAFVVPKLVLEGGLV